MNTTDLLIKFRFAMSGKTDQNEFELLESLNKVNVLILDDFGVEKMTDWAYQMLYSLINYRYENLKTTIYTSNLDLEELAAHTGDSRLTSRIQEDCTIIKFDGEDYRAKRN